jgi:hypothetical protein
MPIVERHSNFNVTAYGYSIPLDWVIFSMLIKAYEILYNGN